MQGQLSSTSLGERTTEPRLLPESSPSVLNNFKFSLRFFFFFPDKDFSELCLNRSRCTEAFSLFFLFVVLQNSWSSFPRQWMARPSSKRGQPLSSFRSNNLSSLSHFFFLVLFSPKPSITSLFLALSLEDSATAYPYQPCGGAGMRRGHF